MTYRKHHGFIALLILAFVTASSASWVEQTHSAQAQTSGAVCPAGNFLTVDNATTGTAGAPLAPGPHQVSLSASSTLAPLIQNVRFTLDNQTTPLGRGIRLNNNPYWNMTWFTQVTPGGAHTVGANLELVGGTCRIESIPVVLANATTQANLSTSASPVRFDGYTNEPRDFVLQSTVGGAAGLDVTKWTIFQKNPVNLGAVTPSDGLNSFRFSAGTVPGDSVISVIAQYGGISQPMTIPVKVYAQLTPNTTQSTTDTTTGTTGTGSNTTSTTTATTPAAKAAAAAASPAAVLAATADLPIKNCVTSKLTEPRYLAVTSGQERVTAAEFDALRQCFAIRNYVLQTNLVPVAADKATVKTKPVSDNVSIGSATNPVVTTNDSDKQVLKFSGKAKPNTTVLLYIFSEPLVLSTSTDSNGDWSYSLEDPLQPGSHEAFALVDKGDGNYERSEVFGFVLAKAEAASATSNGYSLQLDKNQPTSSSNRRPVVIYTIAVLALIVTVLVIVAAVLMRRSHHQLAASEALPNQDASYSDSMVVAATAPAVAPAQPAAPVGNTLAMSPQPVAATPEVQTVESTQAITMAPPQPTPVPAPAPIFTPPTPPSQPPNTPDTTTDRPV